MRSETVATTVTASPPDDRASSEAPSGYRVGDLIGRGGMGEIMLADDLQLDRKVEIKRYLDGDRDTERRRALAIEQLAIARAAIATAAPARRGEAMSAAGRALALDPESREAASLVTQLMLEPPRELPAPLSKRLADLDLETIMRMGRSMAMAMSAYFLFVPLLAWADVRDWRIFIAGFLIVGVEVIGGRHLGQLLPVEPSRLQPSGSSGSLRI